MKTSSLRLGPGAASLILVLVILTMSVLAMLTLTSARNDETLGSRAIQVAQEISGLDEQAEITLMQIDSAVLQAKSEAENSEEYLEILLENLPENTEADEEAYSVYWTEENGERYLDCEVRIPDLDEDAHVVFIRHDYYADMEDTWDDYGID